MDVSLIAGGFLVFGVVAAFLSGAFLDKTKRFKQFFIACAVVSLLCIAVAFWSLPYGNVYIFTANTSIAGMAIVPVISLGYAYAVQLTYPIVETMSTGILQMFA